MSCSCKNESDPKRDDLIVDDNPEEIVFIYEDYDNSIYSKKYIESEEGRALISKINSKFNVNLKLVNAYDYYWDYQLACKTKLGNGVFINTDLKKYLIEDVFPNCKILDIANYEIPFFSNILVELYDTHNNSGLLSNYFDNKRLYNYIAVDNKVYTVTFDEYIYPGVLLYNYDKIKQNGLDDPLELFYRGEWTIEKFWEYYTFSSSETNFRNVISSNILSGLLYSSGNEFFDLSTMSFNLDDEKRSLIYDYLLNISSIKKSGFSKFRSELFDDWFVHPLKIYDEDYSTSYAQSNRFVPYPSYGIEPVFSSFSYQSYDGTNVLVDKPVTNNGEIFKINDNDVYGIDFSNSNYLYNCDQYHGLAIIDKENINNQDENIKLLNIMEEFHKGLPSVPERLFGKKNEENNILYRTLDLIGTRLVFNIANSFYYEMTSDLVWNNLDLSIEEKRQNFNDYLEKVEKSIQYLYEDFYDRTYDDDLHQVELRIYSTLLK